MKLFKKKSKTLPPPPPREAAEINKSYNTLCAELGRAEYNAYTWAKHASTLKEQLLKVDVEMAARQKLDEEAKTEAKQQETVGKVVST